MNKTLLTFSNGEKLELYENQLVIPIGKLIIDNKTTVSQQPTHELWYHSSAGMIPSITELLVKYEFFHLLDNSDKIYKSSAVVTVENL